MHLTVNLNVNAINHFPADRCSRHVQLVLMPQPQLPSLGLKPSANPHSSVSSPQLPSDDVVLCSNATVPGTLKAKVGHYIELSMKIGKARLLALIAPFTELLS